METVYVIGFADGIREWKRNINYSGVKVTKSKNEADIIAAGSVFSVYETEVENADDVCSKNHASRDAYRKSFN